MKTKNICETAESEGLAKQGRERETGRERQGERERERETGRERETETERAHRAAASALAEKVEQLAWPHGCPIKSTASKNH